ncbi:MAG: 2-polyprenylphenol 6-hydroxylase [Rickettsiaceae bacterium]|nr:2-polyprenylphenol 6-hydroxylase [Rickettsiaceae bacterium]
MINFFKNLVKLLKLLRILGKHQILTHPDDIKPPYSLKVIGWLSCLLHPTSLIFRPKHSFGKRIVHCFCELGPIYIKFGQTLSTRPDLIGSEIAENLKIMQDRLPSFDSKIARKIIEDRFNTKIEDIFDEFNDTPVAAASIAQVHKARLKSGEEVAVKILRPGIKQRYESDMCFLEYSASISYFLCKKIKRLKLKEVMAVFRRSMKFELDLRTEAAAASRIYDNFIGDDTLRIPKIHWSTTSHDIITLEWIDGVSIYDREKILELKIDPIKIAEKISVIFFNQAYRDGFFHADLHPGNILVCPDGKVALLDFGIVGTLPEEDRLAIAEILYAFLQRDYMMVAQVHRRIGYIPKDTNLDHFSGACRAIAEPIIGKAIKDISIGNLLSQLFEVTEEFGMETQPQLLLLQKTMVVVEGIGRTLNEDINMWDLAHPWIKKWAAKNLSPEAKILRFVKKILVKICE